jgi:hypothetical protein
MDLSYTLWLVMLMIIGTSHLLIHCILSHDVLEPAMAELERPERLQIMLSVDELEALENWRFERRMPSRAAAVRELLRRGLASDGFLVAGMGTKSQDFGVLPRSNGGDRQSDSGSGDGAE